jgi:hypothetical protein
MDIQVPQSKFDDPTFTAFVAKKLKDSHPDLAETFKNAQDYEVIEVLRQMEAPNAGREEWAKALENKFGPPPHQKSGISPAAIATGIGALGLGVLGAALHVRGKSFSALAEKASEATLSPIAGARSNIVGAKATSGLSETMQKLQSMGPLKGEQVPQRSKIESVSGIPKSSTEPVSPEEIQKAMGTPAPPGRISSVVPGTPSLLPTPSTRAHQTFDPKIMYVLKRLEVDPSVRFDLARLGGGTPESHAVALDKALAAGAMPEEQIIHWKAGTPVSKQQELQAGFTMWYWQGKLDKAFNDLDGPAAENATNMIAKLYPGWHNITAEFGGGLEAQKLFKMTEEITSGIAELRAGGAPTEVVQKYVTDKMTENAQKLKEKELGKFLMGIVSNVEDYATRVKLTSPVTHGVNTISNTFTYLQRGAERVATGVQAGLQGDVNTRDAYLKYAFGPVQSFKDAARKSLADLVNPTRALTPKAELRARLAGESLNSKYPLPLRLMNPYRWLQAADNFWKSVIIDSEMYTKAHIQATYEGRTGEAVGRRIEELIKDPAVRNLWFESANNVAKEYTFQQDPDAILKAFQKFQQVPFGRLIVPFVQTPYNIMTFYRRRSPFGLISKRLVEDFQAGGLRRMEALSRLGIGMGITGGAWMFFQNGQITGPYPSNKKERDLWITEGRRPWSFRVGKYWFQYSRFQPVGAYLMSVAAFDKAAHESNFEANNKTQSKLGRALGAFFKGPLDLPLLQGLSTFFDMLEDPERNVNRFKNLLATGFVPNFLRDITIQLDPTQRRPTNMTEAVEAMIPGLSQNVPERLDVFGQPLQWAPGAAARGSKVLTKSSETDKTNLMRNLGWVPPIAQARLSQGGESVDLQGTTKQRYLEEMGQAASIAMDMVTSQPDFNTWSDDEKRKELKTRTMKMQQVIRTKYEAYMGLRGEAAQEEAKAMMGEEGGQ